MEAAAIYPLVIGGEDAVGDERVDELLGARTADTQSFGRLRDSECGVTDCEVDEYSRVASTDRRRLEVFFEFGLD